MAKSKADLLQGTLDTRVPERGFDFSLDYVVRNELALTLLDIAQQKDVMGDEAGFQDDLERSRTEFLRVLELDSENATAHANLAKIAGLAGDQAAQEHHRRLHDRYKLDDNASAVALPAARRKYPAASHAADSARAVRHCIGAARSRPVQNPRLRPGSRQKVRHLRSMSHRH